MLWDNQRINNIYNINFYYNFLISNYNKNYENINNSK